MTDEELLDYENKKKEARKEAREKAKREKEIYIRKCRYADQMREDWHTEWQWLRDYRRIINDGATWEVGKTLNNYIGRDWYVFGSDYCYFNIKDTSLITDDNEYQRLLEESNKRYWDTVSKESEHEV